MLKDVLKRENVQTFFNDIVTGCKYIKKDIPHTISDEKIDNTYYSVLMGLDAIIKYSIIVDDKCYFDQYLKQIEFLLRKVETHNEIKMGINKILIKFCQKKLNLVEIDSLESKETILKYIYNKYIVNGYMFHSFPSLFEQEVYNNGLAVANYNYELDSLKEIKLIFDKYGLNNIFSKKIDVSLPYLTLTDSPFMGCYYAYNNPYFLNELSVGLLEKNYNYLVDSYFLKDYKKCKKNLNYFMKKNNMNPIDMEKVNDFFDKEWDLFKVSEAKPVMCFVKRSSLDKNFLTDINKIVDELKDNDLASCVNKVLETRYNDEMVEKDISRLYFEIVSLPVLEDLGYLTSTCSEEIIIEEIEDLDVISDESSSRFNTNDNIDYQLANDYGNVTIVALLGVLLITLGVTLTLIMIGRL